MEKRDDVYGKVFPVFEKARDKSDVGNGAAYERLYKESVEDPEAFWGNGMRCLTWVEANDRLRELMARDGRENRQ